MRKTTIMIPPAMHRRASQRAREEGISLAGLVRRLLEETLEGGGVRGAKKDSIFRRRAYRGPAPRDGALDHDKYLYDEP